MTQTMTAAQYRRSLEGQQTPAKRPGPARRAPHKAGQMNGLEAEYLRTVLEPRRAAGEVLDILFEDHTFRLATRTGYTPDFVVTTAQGFEVHEVKGFWEDDARAKWKIAAEKFWGFRFFAATRCKKSEGGGFNIEEYGQAEAVKMQAVQQSLDFVRVQA